MHFSIWQDHILFEWPYSYISLSVDSPVYTIIVNIKGAIARSWPAWPALRIRTGSNVNAHRACYMSILNNTFLRM